MNTAVNTTPIEHIALSGENLTTFKKAIKIGYYKAMLREGIISHTEYGKLMEIINRA